MDQLKKTEELGQLWSGNFKKKSHSSGLASSCHSEKWAMIAGLKAVCESDILRGDEDMIIYTDSQSTIKAFDDGPLTKNDGTFDILWNYLSAGSQEKND